MPEYKPKPPPGPIERAESGKPLRERQRIRGRAIIDAMGQGTSEQPIEWTDDDGVTYRVTHGPTIQPDDAVHPGFLAVVVEATDANGNPLPTDNPYYWQLPDVTVPDGTYRKETIDRPEGPEEVDVANATERPSEAFKNDIRDAVLTVASRHGWEG